MTSIQQNEKIRQWATEYSARRTDLEAELMAREDFQAWATEQIAQQSWTLAGCIARILDQEDWRAQLPSFPRDAAPSWVGEIDDSLLIGGELTVMFYGTRHSRGKASAQISWGLNVVVGPNGGSMPSGEDEPIGTVAWFEGGPDVMIDQFADYVSSWQAAENAAMVLKALSEDLRVIAEEMAA